MERIPKICGGLHLTLDRLWFSMCVMQPPEAGEEQFKRIKGGKHQVCTSVPGKKCLFSPDWKFRVTQWSIQEGFTSVVRNN